MATYSFIKNGKVRALRNPDLTDEESSSSEEDEILSPQAPQNCVYFWLWESDNGYEPYTMTVSQRIDQLNINQVYELKINNQRYEIKKIAIDEALQTNENGLYRKVIRRSNNLPLEKKQKKMNEPEMKQELNHNANYNNNSNANYSIKSNTNHAEKQLEYMWFSSHDDGAQDSLGYHLSVKLNNLDISGIFDTYIGKTQFLFTKITEDICQQNNIFTGELSTVIRQKTAAKAPQNANKKTNHVDNSPKSHSNWCWLTDIGGFEPFGNDISAQLDALQIEHSITVSIGNDGSRYLMTKIANDIVSQMNIKSKNIRQVQKF